MAGGNAYKVRIDNKQPTFEALGAIVGPMIDGRFTPGQTLLDMIVDGGKVASWAANPRNYDTWLKDQEAAPAGMTVTTVEPAAAADGSAPAPAPASAGNEPAPAADPAPDSLDTYLHGGFLDALKQDQEGRKLLTGFDNLDRITHGLYTGLYVLAAATSIGKTTFVYQLANQVAEAGRNVLYFSFEISKYELTLKSLARTAFLFGSPSAAFSATDVRRGDHVAISKAEAVIDPCAARLGGRLSVIECNFTDQLKQITEYTEAFMKANQEAKPPLVVIDYLQAMRQKPADKGDRRLFIDGIVTALKDFSRDHDLTIILISSMGRNGYEQPVSFESLKESGGIEYTADGVFGLQLQAVTSNEIYQNDKNIVKKREATQRARAEIPRRL